MGLFYVWGVGPELPSLLPCMPGSPGGRSGGADVLRFFLQRLGNGGMVAFMVIRRERLV